jgi:uncharacterized protein (TIGR02246 family)
MRLPLLASFLLFFCSTSFAYSRPARESDLAAIKDLDRRDAAAAKLDDVDTLVSLWTDDGVLLQPFSDPVIGKEAIQKRLRQQKQMSEQSQFKTLAYDEDWTERKIVGDRAWEWGAITVKTQLPNGRVVTEKAYLLRILSRQADGTWRFQRVAATLGPPPQRPPPMSDQRNLR